MKPKINTLETWAKEVKMKADKERRDYVLFLQRSIHSMSTCKVIQMSTEKKQSA